ncbi:hypothetical protein TVAG_043250 [Trichomonas vaginalis G3]|uniref:Surface antigen BspA-like n=1 Tax=Trichomonas vaginalis (strain ATCC PRA-98 / G3) TaxID=412133 RepID=A2GCC6_TRIV3|nr:leucine-rich repeats (6 copies)-containing protein [Trichomonas vaginalis G3]EAX85193.1 hypothetical protein TVAG_043250 [Trichomonas vaginalis G3]KAI5551884.1 leucine-rich repeats (6 copies)-containing protein [Trichomonas vaginalis G3]|eukprot:XP_001298123.1 hypothetical protein [Trichomonas vaginalis G3]
MRAFEQCSGLTVIIIPDSVVEIDSSSFIFCENLQRIQLPMSMSISNDMLLIGGIFPQNCIINYKFKKNDTKILSYSYYNNQKLTEINLNKIFFGNETLDLPENLISIEKWSFVDCPNLEKINLPASVKQIGKEAFHACEKLVTVIFNSLDISLSYQSFSDSIAFQFPEPEYGYKAYEYSRQGNEELTIPSNITYLPPFCFYDSFFVNLSLKSIKKIGTNCFAGARMTEIDLTGVEILGGCAFANCPNLERVILSDSLIMIGEYAFYSCDQLRILEFNTQHSIELQEYAFSDCNGLDISLILSKIEYVPDYCFAYLKNVQEIIIPSNIEYIGDGAFSGSYEKKKKKRKKKGIGASRHFVPSSPEDV